MSEKQISIKILAPKYWDDDKSFQFIQIEVNGQVYDFNESSEGENLLETIINVNLTGSHLCELNYQFVYYYLDGFLGTTNSKLVKIAFKNIENELKLYFLNDLNLDSEKNKEMLNEMVDYIPNINLINSNVIEEKKTKTQSTTNNEKIKLISSKIIKALIILIPLGFAVTISVLTFGIGFIPLTLFGTVLATKIGISVIASIFFIAAISFLCIFIYDAYKYKLTKNLSNNTTIDKKDILPNSQNQSTQINENLSIDQNNSLKQTNNFENKDISW